VTIEVIQKEFQMQRSRNRKGQSLVEYAIGIGAVSAVCLVALSFLGHISGDIFYNMQSAINYGGAPGDHGLADPGRLANNNQTPWLLQ
jgi:hypothetical protein